MNWFGDRTQIIIVFIAASFIILYFTPNKILATDESQVLIYLVDSEPFGIPYYKWTESWWNWLLSIPKDSTPALDTDGKQCQQGMDYTVPCLILGGVIEWIS